MTESQALDYRLAVAFMVGSVTGIIKSSRDGLIAESMALELIERQLARLEEKRKEIAP